MPRDDMKDRRDMVVKSLQSFLTTVTPMEQGSPLKDLERQLMVKIGRIVISL
jgi:hypothetical protein